MIRKEVIGTLLFLIIMSSAIASATGDVAYIYRKSYKIDQNVISAFEDLDLTVDLINENSLPIDLSQYRFLFVGDENFKKENRILVNDYPSIIANYYHADYWGLTDNEGVSSLASTEPLSVLLNNRMIQVYTQAETHMGGPSIPYYFLDTENKVAGLETITLTETTASGAEFGDVIAYASPGIRMLNGKTQNAKMCFFGIIESDFWTSSAESLFNDCIVYVADACKVDADCADSTFSDPFCHDGDVYKTETYYTCEINSLGECVAHEKDILVEECAQDCEAGSCVGKCESNSDCGTDEFIGDLFCTDKDVTQNFKFFTCNNAGESDSYCSYDIEPKVIETCDDACANGFCHEIECYNNGDCDDVNPITQDLCHNAGTIESFCTNEQISCSADAQCGTPGFITDPTCSGLNIIRDYETFTCNNPGTSTSFCSSNIEQKIIQTCSETCVSGQCEDPTCSSDADCNDYDSLTLDTCINPGTLSSRCENTEINCASNADCGISGYIGSEFCQNNDVFKTYRLSICQNPGTLESNCKITNENLLIQECSGICVSGACEESICSKDSDCNDQNPLTKDECINPNTKISECRNTPITCASNNDCDASGYTGAKFCSSNTEISRNYESSTCVNPGELTSTCNSQSTSYVIEECDHACANGECVRCNANPDCDDQNPLTQDVCHDAGTQQSHCTNLENTDPTITCSTNEQCGTNAPASVQYCSDKDVTQLIKTWTCNNPATTESFCSSQLIPETITTCSEYCANGECVSIECFNHVDCDDSNDLTIDLCNNPATPESFCTNTPMDIVCSSDSDCGNDGYIGDPFCYYGNSAKLFQDFVCHNAGTYLSTCSTSVEQRIIEECAYECEDGTCKPQEGECTPGEIRSCGSSVGQCSQGVQFCVLSAEWTEQCFGEITPTTEICDGLDNDCDGETDEGDVCGPQCTNECTTLDLRRCSSNDVEICRDHDQDSCLEWGFQFTCDETSTCQGEGNCIPNGPTCTDDCSTNQRICSGNGYSTCGQFDSDSCLDWSPVVSCSSGESCNEGYCEQTCTNECVLNSKECFNGIPRICGNTDTDHCTEWVALPSCQSNEVCQNGNCILTCTDECTTLDQRRCSGNNVEICRDHDQDSCLEWGFQFTCDSGSTCQAQGNCIPNPTYQCSDGIDNDNDGYIDFPSDAGCSSRTDNSESPFNAPQCDDGIDNDNDGYIDYPSDSQCTSRLDLYESS